MSVSRTVELKGTIGLEPLEGAQAMSADERAQSQMRRLADVMIVVEANKAALCNRICEAVSGREGGAAMCGVTLEPAQTDAAFSAAVTLNGEAGAAAVQRSESEIAQLVGETLTAWLSQTARSAQTWKPVVKVEGVRRSRAAGAQETDGGSPVMWIIGAIVVLGLIGGALYALS